MKFLWMALLSVLLAQAAGSQPVEIGPPANVRLLAAGTGRTSALRLGTSTLATAGEDFRIILDGRTYSIRDFRLARLDARPEEITVALSSPAVDVTVGYILTGPGSLRKTVRLRPKHDAMLERIDVESLVFPKDLRITIARGDSVPYEPGNLPICAFLEHGRDGAFASLDFAYSEIHAEGGLLRIGYRPYEKLRAGDEYEAHSVTLGGYRLAGERQGPYDRAAAAAFRRYIRFDYAPPHWKPAQLIYSSIVNRYTEIDPKVPPAKPGETPIANTIYYTLSDANYYMLRPEKIRDEIDFAKSLSMDFCQVYEGPFEWIPGNPAAATAKRIGEYARDRGILLGMYTGANHLTAPHFNDYAQDKGRPEWKTLLENGKRGSAYCWGSDAFAKWFTDVLIQASREFNFRQANYDFLAIEPCYDPTHGHAPGERGIYRQVRNLVRCLNSVRRSVPGYTYDSNLGWPPFVPKIARSMDAFYLNDPHFTTYFPTLNSTESLDDSRRFEMVSYYLNFLTPVEYFRNCEYFVAADSILPDSQTLEYGILQGLALTPNLQLGETRALFDRLSPADQERARRFLSRWTRFVKDNWEYYADTRLLTGLPQLGQVEIYAHAKQGRSLVFLVNPNVFPREASLHLDESIGIEAGSSHLVHELYPEDQLRAARDGLYAAPGEPFRTTVPARTVMVLEIARPPEYGNPPLRIADVPASADRFPGHYRVQVDALQGERRSIRLFLPPGERVTRIESGNSNMEFYPAPGGYAVAVQFPKERVVPDVLRWAVKPGSAEDALKADMSKPVVTGDAYRFPQLESDVPASNFLGARIENLLNERFSRELLVYFGPGTQEAGAAKAEKPHPEARRLAAGGDRWWYSAQFPVAYVQRYIAPAPDQHNYIALNFRKPAEVREVRAWLNGKEAYVDRFHLARAPAWAVTYYLDGTHAGLKRGENVLNVFVRYGKAE